MRNLLVLLAVCTASVSLAGTTTEVLVLTTATALPQSATRKGILIENRGPNPIWCAFSSAAAVVGKAHKVDTGERFPVNMPDSIWCVAETANQVTYNGSSPSTTGGTVVSVVP